MSKEYLDIVQKQKLKDLTNNQSRFLEFILDNKDLRDEMIKIGDLDKVFVEVRNYFKGRHR